DLDLLAVHFLLLLADVLRLVAPARILPELLREVRFAVLAHLRHRVLLIPDRVSRLVSNSVVFLRGARGRAAESARIIRQARAGRKRTPFLSKSAPESKGVTR